MANVMNPFYQSRDYREFMDCDDLEYFTVVQCETDLRIAIDKQSFSKKMSEDVEGIVGTLREVIMDYVDIDDDFLHSLKPIAAKGIPRMLIEKMMEASQLAGVGPMATVAGAIAQFTAVSLRKKYFYKNIIIENGGDLYVRTDKKRVVAVYAGDSPLSGKIGIVIDEKNGPIGICTSSGTVGHSLSFGRADAAVVLAPSALVADAFATALGNRVKSAHDIKPALNWLCAHEEVIGGVLIIGDQIGAVGKVQLTSLNNKEFV